ncbi:hypothetical protein LTR05_008480 [Lithohypha guttulata]|uniref:Major facilitator superfamily (MFS) profile domain-containing protein n=1 Tax=Lithohypha guttulata TaxID=1690604 RepID=A0AAN7SET3_9EURO|nr:hypothetical protein LTR05_008480 [Lithohypha guttulata]
MTSMRANDFSEEDDVPQKAFFKNFKTGNETGKTRPSDSKSTDTIVGIEEVSEHDDPPTWKPKMRERMIMITMAISSLVVALDATILVPVLPTLAVELNGSSAQAFWTGTSYLLAHSVLQPTIASLSDIFGRRELLIPSILFFAAGSVACGAAHDFTVMLLGRVIQGVGGAGIIALSQLCFADVVPLRFRPKYFTLVLGAWAIGTVTGPLIGGVLVEEATWRWCFYLNLPICGIALPMSFFLGQLSQPKTDLITKIRSIDWSGNALFIASVTSLLIGISWAGIQYAWNSYQTVVPLVLGAIGLLGTMAFEARVTQKPFLNKNIFNNRSAIASYLCAMFQGLALYMAMYYLAFYFTAAQHFSPIRTGLSIIPATATMLPASSITNALITRFGSYRAFIWVGFVISTFAGGLFIMWTDQTKTPVWAACQCIYGLGMGMVLSAVNVSIQAAVEPEYAGQAAAMYAFMRSIGMALGVAIGGTVFQNVMKAKLLALNVPHAAEIAKESEGYIEILKKMSTTGEIGTLRGNIMAGYVHGFKGIWITMTALCAAGLIASVFIKKGSLDKKLQSRFRVATFALS